MCIIDLSESYVGRYSIQMELISIMTGPIIVLILYFLPPMCVHYDAMNEGGMAKSL